MSETRFDVLGVGNAIVDVLAPVDEAFIEAHGLVKDAMILIDEARADALYAAFPEGEEISGGSAANTLAGVASFGARGAYIGKVADDGLGQTFARDLRAAGVHFDTAPLSGGPSTARCLIAVPPDARRAMSTYLGASTLLDPDDIDRDLVAAARVVFLEGYLFDREEAKAAYVRASELAAAAGRAVALTLSDIFCVERHRASFRHLVRHHVDVLFANEAELKSLYETDNFDEALAAVRAETRIAAVTRSEKRRRDRVGTGGGPRAGHQNRAPRGHDGRRRPVRRRLPHRLCTGPRSGDLRTPRRHRRGRSHHPFRRPPPRES